MILKPGKVVDEAVLKVGSRESKFLLSADHRIRVGLWTDGRVVVKVAGHAFRFRDAAHLERWLELASTERGPSRDWRTVLSMWRLLRDDE